MLGSARRLCQAEVGSLRLSEQAGLRLVAVNGNLPWLPELVEHSSYIGQFAASRSPVHIPDQAALELYRRGGDPCLLTTVNVGGFRTALFIPMVTDEKTIGVFTVGRTSVQPFTDKQVELVTDFAAQATIALEITRRERQLREMQMELAHANRVATIGQLTASIVHEVMQPIATIVTNARVSLRLLDAPTVDLDELRQIQKDIVKGGKRAGEVINHIRDLFKKSPPRRDQWEINGAIREVIELTRGEAMKNCVTVQTELPDHLPHVHGDRVQLQQVILNLIMNAIQAMSGLTQGVRELHIGTESAGPEGVRVSVRDSGPGLSTENLQRLFEPFYTTKENGMGMGLSICRSIIEDHGGRLWASGLQPHGALFQFTIPAP